LPPAKKCQAVQVLFSSVARLADLMGACTPQRTPGVTSDISC